MSCMLLTRTTTNTTIECAMPPHLDSNVDFGDCTHLYGPLLVRSDVSHVKLSGKTSEYIYTGCIRINNTKLVDLSFLEKFRDFTAMPNCQQYIAGNEELCVEDPSELREWFPGINIYDNMEPCGDHQCYGGAVTESYLEETAECTTRVGDLIITQWHGKPPNINILYKTKEIHGRLIIYHNQGLGDFDYFKNVEKIGKPSIRGREPVMTVVDNEGLTSLKMSKLEELMQQQTGVRVKIAHNEQLQMATSDVDRLVTAAGGSGHADIQPSAYSKRASSRWTTYIIYVIVAAAVLFSCFLLFFYVRIKPRLDFDMLPSPPLRLSKKSQTILAEMCREILKNNPMVWRIQDRQLIWRYAKDDPQRAAVAGLADKHSKFLKNHRAELIPNAYIPRKSEKALERRFQSVVSQPLILMIGKDDTISNVVPSLPNDNGDSDEHANNDSTMKLTLARSKYVGDQTVNFIYKIITQRKGEKPIKKKIHILLYVWGSLRLPIEFQDILQVLRFFANKKTICVSNRRKEVFSMIHLIYTYVYVLCESIGVVEAFQLHTETCNGAPLDSNEMLMVMAFILEWAHQSFSVPPDLVQKHADWCHTYARMSAFSKEHPNIVNIRPDHLVTSRRITLQEEIKAAGPRPGAIFSERPEEAVVDKMRRRTKDELKGQKGQAAMGLRREEQKKVTKEDDETETNAAPPETSGVFFQKRYRAGPDDPFRIAEEKRIAEALKKRTKVEVLEKSGIPKSALVNKSAQDRIRAAGSKTPEAKKASKSASMVPKSASMVPKSGSMVPKSGSMVPKSAKSSKRKKSKEQKKPKS
ncbi:hypothetical protein Y032_0113g404 [Ancylostoma ceylanicum]|uniref:Receptor L-domain domain-containing protein n=1 Tax=Ancylostoma ceylanicum TaxID=53326 RepID=A0A016TDK5_9BILA|nr:hypothetical protein Y032_0113g404 [Ancylostoma ceylanicum]